jgi:hypothetical protein
MPTVSLCACGEEKHRGAKVCQRCHRARGGLNSTPEGQAQYRRDWYQAEVRDSPEKIKAQNRQQNIAVKGDSPEEQRAWQAYNTARCRVTRLRKLQRPAEEIEAARAEQLAAHAKYIEIRKPKQFERRVKKYGTRRRNYRHEGRQALLNWFGASCVKCGYDADWRALHVDHINGDGWKERTGARGGAHHKQRLDQCLANPEWARATFQVLCACCNAIKRFENQEYGERHPWVNGKGQSHSRQAKHKAWRYRRRQALLNWFGATCVRCGYDEDWRALQLDHINDDAWKERRGSGTIPQPHKLLHQCEADPKWARSTLQVLCARCNAIKQYECDAAGFSVPRFIA